MNFKELAESLELEEHEFLEMVELFVETSDSDLNKLKCVIDEGKMEEVVIGDNWIKGDLWRLTKRLKKLKKEHEIVEQKGWPSSRKSWSKSWIRLQR
jgi:archaellum component FlaC